MEKHYQVIIVGGGPVGVALAVDLGLRGISCALVERHLSPQRIPKGQNLTQRTLEHFYFWGVSNELRAARALPPGYPIGGITAYGNLMSDHWYSPTGRETVRQYYFQDNDRVPQYTTEEVLRKRMTEIPEITSHFGWSMENIDQDENGVRGTIVNQISSDKQVLTADYLVGCDGARSIVREQLGIPRTGTDFEQKMALLVFRSRELHEGLKRFPERTTYRVLNPDLQGVWQFFGRIDVGEGWFFHGPVPADTTVENYNFRALLQRAAGFPFSATLDHIGFWDLRAAVATSYRQERAFIAGDAAHSHPPYGAFGLNSGLEDVKNLGWKIAAALHGWGGDALLDSYSLERQPIFMETGEDIIAGGIKSDRAFLDRYRPDQNPEEFQEAWNHLESAGSSRPGGYEPHYEGSPIIMGPPNASCSIHGSHSFTARSGHHLSPQQLSSGANVFEELGSGFTLIALGAEEQELEVIQRASQTIRVPLEIVCDTYEGDRKAYGSRLIMVRPDQFVAWTGDTLPDEPSKLLQKVAGVS